MNCRLDVPYGPSADETLDIFPAREAGSPLVVYIHGGAWTRGHKDNDSYQAPAFVDAGAAFVSVNFGLVPAVSLDTLVAQCRAAVKWAYENAARFGADSNRLFVAGHSSGGHVAVMLAVHDWAGDGGLPGDIVKGVFAASGMYDLEPVRLSSRNAYLALDNAAARRNSPVHQIGKTMPPMVIAHGGGEHEEFRRQSTDFARLLEQRGHDCQSLVLGSLNHFEVGAQFANPDGALLRAVFAVMGLAGSRRRGAGGH
jgi:arylformamidase